MLKEKQDAANRKAGSSSCPFWPMILSRKMGLSAGEMKYTLRPYPGFRDAVFFVIIHIAELYFRN